ncbi:hypothetical protein TMatcc_008306 [Talaromyces marneffei ATCC 18224]|uniref:Cytoplasmic protein required for cell viability, putative n=2 Tax=Talaromyces marneffei TaxID=37727 RepID=B6QMG7_TALMQ|nr:uncharacterized protein EYB26_007655 [Talaromyces marneffei]EEA22255.1 cytoplasmic protein required for cell viability, putative [Talaromyces marneffei ATCC 18224]KAE8550292.1 hypothetical protein EYB25_006516 [Talaromyces marneffei]QGA19957.1 hypothetical protein EYB26_007655 [Talaromyces marneffei]
MAEMQNANPTILNTTDLPTRQRKSSTAKNALVAGQEYYEGTVFYKDLALPELTDPFALRSSYSSSESESDDNDNDENIYEEPIDEQEIYDLVSTISDPEHPISLGSLAVVSLPDISISPSLPANPSSPLRTVTVLITPTITHCSLATVIGLGVRVRLEQSLPPRFRVDVRIKEGTHSTAEEVNKQLADKERVAAALENGTLMGVIGKMLETCA